jgi:hypothetical protein
MTKGNHEFYTTWRERVYLEVGFLTRAEIDRLHESKDINQDMTMHQVAIKAGEVLGLSEVEEFDGE